MAHILHKDSTSGHMLAKMLKLEQVLSSEFDFICVGTFIHSFNSRKLQLKMRPKFIIDCDTGIDDAMALLIALQVNLTFGAIFMMCFNLLLQNFYFIIGSFLGS